MQQHIDSYIEIMSNQRFKLWAIVGKDNDRKENIIKYMQSKQWTLVDVGVELKKLTLQSGSEEIRHDIGTIVKEWFHSKPDNLILVNASILYHKSFGKISPIGAFKYNSRNKNCIIFLEDEKLISNRLSYGKAGSEDYYDQDINDILINKIDDIKENYNAQTKERKIFTDKSLLNKNAIGQLFNYTPIKDVIDIDADMKHLEVKKELISSFIISQSLENQIVEFFENINKPVHKAVKIVGNYGSGKSHLIAFLLTSIMEKDFRAFIKNDKAKQAALEVNRNFWTVQFELMPGTADLSTWFYNEIKKQLKIKYNIEAQTFTNEDYNHKDNINSIISLLKKHDPDAGLLVVIDEVSDFLSQKQLHQINRDLQFLRVVAQVCQDTDLLLVTSMQEDVYTSPKFKNIADQESRVGERFQNIQIHKENVKKVIAQRIVPKDTEQRTELSIKLKPYSEKISDVSNRFDEYLDLFPFTPVLLNLFDELPYFEKRGVIQFAQSELRYILNEPFPFFLTYDKIFDLFTRNPNLANLEEIYNSIQAVNIIESKISATIEEKLRPEALKIVKGLAVYSLWSKGKSGATVKQLAESLLILPQHSSIEAYQQVALIIKKVRIATDNFYIKVVKNPETGDDYIKFDPAIDTTNPDEKIDTEINTITEDLVEAELFAQINDILGLEPYNGTPNLFVDECNWLSVKSFRKGYVAFVKKGTDFTELNDRDYVIAFISPFRNEPAPIISKNQLNIKIILKEQENVEALKEIAAIKQLIDKKILTSIMTKKKEDAVDGNIEKNKVGVKFRLARWIRLMSECTYNAKKVNIQHIIGRETDSLTEILSELKPKLFDKQFTDLFPEHPKYALLLTYANIKETLNPIAQDIANGDFTKITLQRRDFLKSLQLINDQNYPDINHSKIAVNILNIIKNNNDKVTDIQKDIVEEMAKIPYGLEPEVVQLILVLLATEGKISLKAKGGDTIDLSNIKEKFKNLSQFENIKYVSKKEDFSYDFASRLISSLGLNGAKIKQESTRNEVFKDYREKVKIILKDFTDTKQLIETLKVKQKLYFDITQVEQAFNDCNVINWNSLQIDYHTHFATIKDVENKLPEMEKAISKVVHINSALRLYFSDIHEGIGYMEKAMEIIKANDQYITDKSITTLLNDFYTTSLSIVKDLTKFFDLAHNRTLRGKVEEFKKKYINDFYYLAHEKTVGKKIEWKKLHKIQENELFKKIQQVSKIDYVGVGEFRTKVQKWNVILNLACENFDLDRMQQIPFCATCNFMNFEKDYSVISKEINDIETTLQTIYDKFVSNAISNITQNGSKLDIVNIPIEHKNKIRSIIETKKLPETLDNTLINSINELFKNVLIKEFSKKDVLKFLFPEEKLFTLEELQKNWYALEEKLKGADNENELRIKIVD